MIDPITDISVVDGEVPVTRQSNGQGPLLVTSEDPLHFDVK